MRRRWAGILVGLLGAALFASLVYTVVSERKQPGEIPGDGAILSLGVLDKSYLIGTTKGLLRSTDGIHWKREKRFGNGPVLLSTRDSEAVLVSDGISEKTSDFKTFEPAVGAFLESVAIYLDDEGNAYLAEKDRKVALSTPDRGIQRVPIKRGPKEVVAIAGIPGDPVTLFLGGLRSGFWRSSDGGVSWRHVLKTPTRAIVVDPYDERRVLIGTAGGIFLSEDTGKTWKYTSMREPIESLSEFRGRFFAVTGDRRIMVVDNELSKWKPLVEE